MSKASMCNNITAVGGMIAALRSGLVLASKQPRAENGLNNSVNRCSVTEAHAQQGHGNRLNDSILHLRISILDENLGDGTDDLYLFPSHGKLSLHFSHEQIVWGSASSWQPLGRFGSFPNEKNWAWVQSEENKKQCFMYRWQQQSDQENQ